MPPKTTPSKFAKERPSKEALEAINEYLSQKPDFEKLIREAKESPSQPLHQKPKTEYDRKVEEAVREVLKERRKQAEAEKQAVAMPVHPKEEEAPSNLTDKVAKMSKDSGASDHPIHDEGLATMEDHRANPGPALHEAAGEQPKASKEELKKRAEELNKKE